MRGSEVKIGEEYYADASQNRRWESDRFRVRVLDAPVEGQTKSRYPYKVGHPTGRKDSALVEILDKETGEVVVNPQGFHLNALNALPVEGGYLVKLASIRQVWSEYVKEIEEYERRVAILEKERDAHLDRNNKAFDELDLSIPFRVEKGNFFNGPDPYVKVSLHDFLDWVKTL